MDWLPVLGVSGQDLVDHHWHVFFADPSKSRDLLQALEIVHIEPPQGGHSLGDGVHAVHIKNQSDCSVEGLQTSCTSLSSKSPHSQTIAEGGQDDGLGDPLLVLETSNFTTLDNLSTLLLTVAYTCVV